MHIRNIKKVTARISSSFDSQENRNGTTPFALGATKRHDVQAPKWVSFQPAMTCANSGAALGLKTSNFTTSTYRGIAHDRYRNPAPGGLKDFEPRRAGGTAVYDRHSYNSEKRDALSKWDGRLAEICDGANLRDAEGAKAVA